MVFNVKTSQPWNWVRHRCFLETSHLALYLMMAGAILSVMMVLGISNKGQNHWKEGRGSWGW